MSRTVRLLELLLHLQTRGDFTAQMLADEFGVSRRTVLRDLRTLSALGIVLDAKPGPGGGYSLPWERRRLSLALSLDEVLALIVSYEALQRYQYTPFPEAGREVLIKLKAALPDDAIVRLERLRRHVAVRVPARPAAVEALPAVLDAAVSGCRLRIAYDSARSGEASRVIEPAGVYAADGFWYCGCRDVEQARDIVLRVDRMRSVAVVSPPHAFVPKPLDAWFAARTRAPRCTVRLRVNRVGLGYFALQPLFERAVTIGEDGNRRILETGIQVSDVDYWAGQLLAAGTDVLVESPPTLVVAIREKVRALMRIYAIGGG